jgi:hypothetical protein
MYTEALYMVSAFFPPAVKGWREHKEVPSRGRENNAWKL